MSIEVDSSDDSSCPREFLDALSWFEGQGLREAEAVSALGSAPVQELIRKDKTGVQCKVLIWLDHNFHTEVLRMTRRLSIRMLPARQLLYHYCASQRLPRPYTQNDCLLSKVSHYLYQATQILSYLGATALYHHDISFNTQ